MFFAFKLFGCEVVVNIKLFLLKPLKFRVYFAIIILCDCFNYKSAFIRQGNRGMVMQNDKNGGSEINMSSKAINEVLEWLESFVFAVFVVILIFIFIFRNVVVDGPSMNPTLSDGDRLIIYHLNYTPERADIVVVNSVGLNKTIIKRCIGIGGDTVRINYSEGTVEVNGEVLEEDYINEEMTVLSGFDTQYLNNDVFEYKVPEGKLFVMGDNRNHSTDSRSYAVGFIDESDVLGKAIFRILPISGFGTIG